MKPRRCINFEPAEIRLFMPLLAVLATVVSWSGLFMFLFCLVNQGWEKEIPLRLHAAGSSERLPNRARSPEIVIQEDGTVLFNGSMVDSAIDKTLPSLRNVIRAHMHSPDAATTVVFVEDQATFERVIDVLNVFAACDYTNCRFVFLTEPIVGPRLPRKDDPNPNAPPSPMQKYLRSLRSGL